MPAIHAPALLSTKADEFIEFLVGCGKSPETIRAYRSDLAGFIDPLDQEITVEHANQEMRKLVRSFIARLHRSGAETATTHRKLAAVKSFCDWLETEGLLKADVSSIKGPQRSKKRPDVPSEADIEKLFSGPISSAVPERDRVILELLYGAGLRVDELCGINLDDFRGEDVLLIRGKGDKERQVIFGEPAQAAVKAWLPVRQKLLAESKIETDALLFAIGVRHSARLTVRSVHRIVRALSKACGLSEYYPHLLRHAFACHMHDHEAALQAISLLLGHEKLSTTEKYVEVSTGRMKKVYDRAHPHARKENQ